MSAASFVALDVETANPDLASICQVGVVVFEDGMIRESWQSLVDPDDEFDPVNVSIHGISEFTVRGAPRFADIASRIGELLAGRIVASHMSFDRLALSRACQASGLTLPECKWLDTGRVCRRAWRQFAQRGFGLAEVASHCGIQFRHHDALDDARVAGEILLRAISETGLGLESWLTRSQQPIDQQGSRATRQGSREGGLFGEEVVFTGSLSVPRREAADMAACAGCAVAASVSKTTTLLVVGDLDVRRLAGHERSAKHRKVEELIRNGQQIRILTERDFLELLRLDA